MVHSHNQRLVVNDLHRTDFTIGIPGMFYVLAGKPLFFEKSRERPGKTLLHLYHDMWCGYLREKQKVTSSEAPIAVRPLSFVTGDYYL